MITAIKFLLFFIGFYFYYDLVVTLIGCHILNEMECTGLAEMVSLTAPSFYIDAVKDSFYLVAYIMVFIATTIPWFLIFVVIPISLVSTIEGYFKNKKINAT